MPQKASLAASEDSRDDTLALSARSAASAGIPEQEAKSPINLLANAEHMDASTRTQVQAALTLTVGTMQCMHTPAGR